ncbi:flagellar basal body P-ring protein FlgI [bacterium]|jgi:flagellar P-ring protein precursor FlgI|nr:flagellar basal body P-ring protein FlgI [bacterium]
MKNRVLLVLALSLIFEVFPKSAAAARLKDIATVKGVRENILIGYGIVVGLKGTGDSASDITGQSLGRLFGKLGLEVQNGVRSKNAAAVIVTSKLPPFARVGNKIDVTVSSIGDSATLEGGVLLVTPLRAGDQNVYAVAQGTVSIGSVADGTTKNFPTVGRVIGGATIEKDLDAQFSNKKSFRLSLHNPDFTTAARVSTLINSELGGKYANAQDSATIDVIVPFNYEGTTVELMSSLENINVNVDSRARVVLNERTGTVVMGEKIGISPVAIAHGELSIEVADTKPGAAAGSTQTNRLAELKGAANVSDLVKALNTLGVQPKDLTAIFQTLREVGALQAELEIM